jgi:hypothetical protein
MRSPPIDARGHRQVTSLRQTAQSPRPTRGSRASPGGRVSPSLAQNAGFGRWCRSRAGLGNATSVRLPSLASAAVGGGRIWQNECVSWSGSCLWHRGLRGCTFGPPRAARGDCIECLASVGFSAHREGAARSPLPDCPRPSSDLPASTAAVVLRAWGDEVGRGAECSARRCRRSRRSR